MTARRASPAERSDRSATPSTAWGTRGLVEIWPTETPDRRQAAPTPGRRSTRRRRARRRCGSPSASPATIDGWLDSGERLASEDRPIRAGDILILVRKRAPVRGGRWSPH